MTHIQELSPRVSVIIIFLNPGAFLEEAIGSVFAQSLQDWELILVDDGSTDESSRVAKSAAERRLGQVRYLEHAGHANLGTSASRDLGLYAARGEYLLYLDADDVLFTKALATLCTLADSQPRIGAVFGTTLSWNWAPEFADRDDNLQDYGRWVGRFDPPTLLIAMVTDEHFHPANCSSLFRRQALLDVGGFEPEFRGMYEDTVLLAKIMLRHSALVTDEAFSAYRMHPASQCHRAAADGSYHRSRPNVSRGRYLRWLKRYNKAAHVRNLRLTLALERELWAYDRPLLFRVANSHKLRALARRVRAAVQPSRHVGSPAPVSLAGRATAARAELAQALDAQGRSGEADNIRQRAARPNAGLTSST